MNTSLRLTDLSRHQPRRDIGGRLRRIYLALIGAREVLTALPHDAAHRRRREPWRRSEPGADGTLNVTSLALYVHYAASGRISDMVRCQLDELRRCGFTIIFITMADAIPDQDWQSVRQRASLVVQRKNFGLDFGAWQDLVPEIRRHHPALTELLLVNDSVLGPITPLAPLLDAMRGGGDGLFGLTESLQNRPHLQSFFLLARGAGTIADLLGFLEDLRITRSKWLLVRRGELRLSGWMRQRGHRVAALFPYRLLIEAALNDPPERRRLQDLYTRFRDLDRRPDAAALLVRWPLNPTHHLWRILVTRFQFPFVKTELIRHNPTGLEDVDAWRSLIPPNAPCPVSMLLDHLKSLTET